MKTYALLLINLFAICTTSSAQISGGVRGGLNFSLIKAKSSGATETSDMMVGFQLGGYLDVVISENVSFRPELVLNRVGGKDSEYDPDSQETIDFTLKADYLSFPLLFKFHVGDKFHFLAGPQGGLLVGAKATVKVFGQSVSIDSKDAYNTFEFGVTGGIGYTISKVQIDARYNLGLTNFAADSEGDDKATHQVIMLGISYRLFEK
jgi:hypothetical protein